jgi:cell division ATPase FtsA
MENNFNFKTFLFIASKKIIISVYSDINQKIYQEELVFDSKMQDLSFDNLDLFLNKNIFKIEKKLKSFIKNVYVILDSNKFFTVEISLKKKNYENVFDLKSLNYLLYEAKDYCRKTIDDRKIIHMIINNYQIDNKSYPFFPIDVSGNNFSIDISFICISNRLIKKLEKILKKYHISLSQVVSANYAMKFLINDEKDIFLMSKKIMNGHNPNEVMLVEKTSKNEGFFEKFFNFFR